MQSIRTHLRWAIWGAVIAASIVTIAALGLAWVRHEWLWNHNKVASHATVTFAREFATPVAAVVGALAGAACSAARTRSDGSSRKRQRT